MLAYLVLAVAVNTSGYIYVADLFNDRVQVFNASGVFQYAIGEGHQGSDNAHFDSPTAVAVNTTGYVYVADGANSRVQVFDNAGIYQYTIGVTGEYENDNNHFSMPWGLAVNTTGHLYVGDSSNDRVQVFDNAGNYQYTIGVTGIEGTDNFHFHFPTAIALNASGHVYVADEYNNRVQVFDNAGNYQYTIGVAGVYGTDNKHFHLPSGIAINNAGYVFISEAHNQRVQVFDNSGKYHYTIGITDVRGSDDTHFNYPEGIAINYTTEHLYVADSANNRVQVFNSSREYVSTIGPIFNPPAHLSITINDGAADTNSSSVTLSLHASGEEKMCFSNDGVIWSSWEPESWKKSWTLPNGAGIRSVYYKARNSFGESEIVFDTITYSPPLPPDLTGVWVAVVLAVAFLGVVLVLAGKYGDRLG